MSWTDDWPCITWSAPRDASATLMWTKDDLDIARREGLPLWEVKPLPWDQRDKVPVWRGMWYWAVCCKPSNVPCVCDPTATGRRREVAASVEELISIEIEYAETNLARPQGQRYAGNGASAVGAAARLAVVKHSFTHPNELNARFAGLYLPHLLGGDAVFALGRKNGLDSLFDPLRAGETNRFNRSSPIEPAAYLGNYQVALVLGGIGAAFRLTGHLRCVLGLLCVACRGPLFASFPLVRCVGVD
jgi:hypothetical protein